MLLVLPLVSKPRLLPLFSFAFVFVFLCFLLVAIMLYPSLSLRLCAIRPSPWLALLALGVLAITFAARADYCATDDEGSRLCLEQRPRRIISLAPATTELLYAAGAGEQLLAVDRYSDYPPAAKTLAKVGGYPTVSIETLVAMKPDLVVIWAGGNAPRLVRQIKALGLASFSINARTLEAVAADIRSLGRISGNESQAALYADRFTARLERLRRAYQGQPPVRVFFEIWRNPLMAIGGQQVINSVIELCGGRNIFADVPAPAPVISMEMLLAGNPDAIIASVPEGQTAASRQAMVAYWRQWPMLSAVRKNQLFAVASDLIARPGPRILDGAEQICQFLQTVRAASDSPHSADLKK